MADNVKLETRFKQLENPEEEMKRFIKDVEWYGWVDACEMWKDKLGDFKLTALQGFLKRMDLPDDFGRVPKLETSSYKSQASVLIEEFLNHSFKDKLLIERLNKENEELRMRIRYLEYHNKAQFRDESIEMQEAIEKIREEH